MGAWSREKPCPQSPVRAGGGVVKGRAPPRIPLEGGVNPLWPHACLPPSQQPSAPLLAPAPTLPLWVLPWPPPCPRGHWREASPAMTSTWAPSGLAAAGLGGPGTPPPWQGARPRFGLAGCQRGAGRAGRAGSASPVAQLSQTPSRRQGQPGARHRASRAGLHPTALRAPCSFPLQGSALLRPQDVCPS